MGVKSLVHLKDNHHYLSPSLDIMAKLNICHDLSMLGEPVVLEDFIKGVTNAVDTVLHAVYSKAFNTFALEDHARHHSKEEQVELLQDVLSPSCLASCMVVIREAHKRGVEYNLRDVAFQQVSVYAVDRIHETTKMQIRVHLDMVHTMRVTAAWRNFIVKKSSSMLWVFESDDISSSALQWRVALMNDFDLRE